MIRAASRLASGLNAAWIAVTLERSGLEIADPMALRRIDEAMLLAERLGAETARLSEPDLPEEILRFARRENITQTVIGRSSPTFWARVRGRSLSGMLLRRASDIAIHVVVGERRRHGFETMVLARPQHAGGRHQGGGRGTDAVHGSGAGPCRRSAQPSSRRAQAPPISSCAIVCDNPQVNKAIGQHTALGRAGVPKRRARCRRPPVGRPRLARSTPWASRYARNEHASCTTASRVLFRQTRPA